MRGRIRQGLCGLAALAALFAGAYLSASILGWGCPLQHFTGVPCPGCGMSRAAFALLRLDFAEAWSWNPGLMLLLPFLAVLGLRAAVRYVRTGRAGPTRGEQIVIGLMVAFLVVYGVVRNLPGFAWLAPGQTPPELFPLLRALP